MMRGGVDSLGGALPAGIIQTEKSQPVHRGSMLGAARARFPTMLFRTRISQGCYNDWVRALSSAPSMISGSS